MIREDRGPPRPARRGASENGRRLRGQREARGPPRPAPHAVSRSLRPHLSAGRASTEHRQRRPSAEGPRPATRTRFPSGPQRRPPSSPWARATGAARARSRTRRRWHPSAARGSPSPSTWRASRAPSAPRPGLATRGAQPPAPGSLEHELHPLRFGRPSSSPSSSLFSTRHVSSCRERPLTC